MRKSILALVNGEIILRSKMKDQGHQETKMPKNVFGHIFLKSSCVIKSGIRHGGILSPALFNIYADGLLRVTNKQIDELFIGHQAINWVDRLKYLGLHFCCQKQLSIDISVTVRN